jgi:hypothetical protein
MTYLFNGEINEENLADLISFSNSIQEPFTLYFASSGGIEDLIPVYLDYFETEGNRIRLVGYSQIYSAAFEIFFRARCLERIILPSTIGMYHQCSISLVVNESGKVSGEEEAKLDNVKDCSNKATRSFLKYLEFTESERKRILANETLYFNYKRMIKFL